MSERESPAVSTGRNHDTTAARTPSEQNDQDVRNFEIGMQTVKKMRKNIKSIKMGEKIFGKNLLCQKI